MARTFKATVTRNSNGSVDLRPIEGEDARGVDSVTINAFAGGALDDFAPETDFDVTIEKSAEQRTAERAAERKRESERAQPESPARPAAAPMPARPSRGRTAE